MAFSPQFTGAVEAKQVAQQEAEMAKWVVDKALEEKKSIIITAAGEAEAAKLIAGAVANNPGFVELREIQYAKDVAETIAKSNFKVIPPLPLLISPLPAHFPNTRPHLRDRN